MIQPEINAEVLEGFKKKVGIELLKIYSELDGIGYLSPDSLTDDKTKRIQASIEALAEEAKMMSQKALAEVLGQISMQFYRLQTVGTVDKLDKFQLEADFAVR